MSEGNASSSVVQVDAGINASAKAAANVNVELGSRTVKYYPLSESELELMSRESHEVSHLLVKFTTLLSVALMLFGVLMTNDLGNLSNSYQALVIFGLPVSAVGALFYFIRYSNLKDKAEREKKKLLEDIGRDGIRG